MLLKHQGLHVHFESRILTLQKVVFISINESPLKMMKYAFYFMLEAFSFLRYLHFCLDTLVM